MVKRQLARCFYNKANKMWWKRKASGRGFTKCKPKKRAKRRRR